MKLSCRRHVIGYADDVNILGGCILNIKKNTEGLVVASKEIGLEANTEKTKYMVVSQDQNAGQNYGIRMDDKCFERWNSLVFWNNLNKSKFYSGRK